MSWRRVGKSGQALAVHILLLCFTVLLVLKLDHFVDYSWWIIFFPLWVFHAVVARGRFSLPAPSVLHDRHWAPCHTVVATPLRVAFELLLCIHLESIYGDIHSDEFDLPPKIVSFLSFHIVHHIMCKALLPGDEESMNDEAIWETLPHFWVAISMVFFVAATVFTLLKLCGDVDALGWWDLFINYGSSSTTTRYLDWNSGLIVSSEEEPQSRMCGLQDLGGHMMKIPIIFFQVLLCMRLEGTHAGARNISLPLLFLPIFLLQGAGVLFATLRFVEKIVLLLQSGAAVGRYHVFSSKVRDCFAFMHHGSRLLGWWSIHESSREEQARLLHDGFPGYNTFCGYPPEIVKKLPKKDLAEEVWRLQAALGEQTEITKLSQQEYERLQNEKVLCRVCFEGEISIVLLPCRHHVLCSSCCEKCNKCPTCRVCIEERLPVYDV
ncbi:unnamed protein product [Withania somnifera]